MTIKTWREKWEQGGAKSFDLSYYMQHEIDELRTALAEAEAKIKAMEGQKPCAAIGWCSLYGATCECSVDGPCERTVNVYLAAGAKP